MAVEGGRARAVGWVLLVGLVPGLVLLGRLAFDLGRLHFVMAAAVGVLLAAFLAITGANVLALLTRSPGERRPGLAARIALGLAVPFGLLASGLDCMGIELAGCTPTCAILLDYVAPAVSFLVLAAALTGGGTWLLVGLVLAFGLLVPNCDCSNPANRWWIGLLGLSPACFAGSYAVLLTSASALASGRRVVPSIVLAWGVVATMLAFWVGHHYYRFPW